MARPLHIEYPGAVDHMMNRGRARQATFPTPTEYETFLRCWAGPGPLWGVEAFPH